MYSSKHPLRLGILREGKVPPDSRVALSPEQAAHVAADPRFDLVVQPSPGRCFADKAYLKAGIRMSDDLSDRDVLIGIKEVPVSQLLPDKTYIFFSHTHKGQLYNRPLLQAVIDRRIRLIDYELLTDEQGLRLIAFGGFAGMVGAHHALRAWGLRTQRYHLPAMHELDGYADAQAAFAKTSFGPVRVVLTGSGRVGQGAAQVLLDAGLVRLSPKQFLAGDLPDVAVFTQLSSGDYLRHREGKTFERGHFIDAPNNFEADFMPFARVADVLIHGIFWDKRAPAMFTLEQAADPDFRIQVISDVTCDIAPHTSIPSTVRASTIAKPYFGLDPKTAKEIDPFDPEGILMCTIDNLPNELSRDASNSFGKMFIELILPELLAEESAVLARATIAADGALAPRFNYLEAFLSQRA